MKIGNIVTVALLTAVPVLLTMIIGAVTEPVTFMDRILVITLAIGTSINVYVILAILGIIFAISHVAQDDLKEN